MFRNSLARRRRSVPECTLLEGRTLLSGVHAHLATHAHAALAARHVHRAPIHHASTMQVNVMSSAPVSANPPVTNVAPAADPPAASSADPVTIGSGSNTATITPLAPGQFGPNSTYKFPGYRPGGGILR